MARLFILTGWLISIFFFTGCMSPQSMAMFRGQRIMTGQSADSVENHLGQPDWAANAQLGSYRLQATKFSMVIPGNQTVEWGYYDNPKSLVLWFEGNNVRAIWLVPTEKLRK